MVIAGDARAWVDRVNKGLGSEVVFCAADMVVPKRFTSGSLSLDVALGGGWPGNKWIEVLGKEQSGKTSVVYKTLAANQALDKDFTTFWLAAEHYDTEWAAACGVDNERVHLGPTQVMEEALDLLLGAVETKAYDAIVLDSYPALIAQDEDAKTMAEYTQAEGARQFNKFWRKAGKASRRAYDGTDRAFLGIVINQWRDKIGGWSPRGVPQTSPGGHGKDYAFYTRVDIARDDFLKEHRPIAQDPLRAKKNNDFVVGQTMRIKTIKNKAAAPQQLAYVDFYNRNAPRLGFRRGEYDLGRDYASMGILLQVIDKAGGWYTFGPHKWNGVDKLRESLREDLTLREALGREVIEAASDPRAVDQYDLRDVQQAVNSGEKKVARR